MVNIHSWSTKVTTLFTLYPRVNWALKQIKSSTRRGVVGEISPLEHSVLQFGLQCSTTTTTTNKKTRYPLFSQIICKQTVLVYFAGCHTGSKNACQASTIHTKFVYTYGPIREKAGAGVFGFSWIICRGLIATNAAALETSDAIKRLRIIQFNPLCISSISSRIVLQKW